MSTNDDRVDDVFTRSAASVHASVDRSATPIPDSTELATRARRLIARRLCGAVAVVVAVATVGFLLAPGASTIDVAGGSAGTTPATGPGSTFTATTVTGDQVTASMTTTSTVPDASTGTGGGPDAGGGGLLSRSLIIDVSPATGLRDGQQVSVSGKGFPPGVPVELIMCTTDALAETSFGPAAQHCDLNSNRFTRAGSDGTFHEQFPAKQHLSTMDGGTADCSNSTIDPAAFVERRDRGEGVLVGPGTWGCGIVGVAMEGGEHDIAGPPTGATAYPVRFDVGGS